VIASPIIASEVHSLANNEASVATVSGLGGRIDSLRDRTTGREGPDEWDVGDQTQDPAPHRSGAFMRFVVDAAGRAAGG
jgi:galactose mutarotase-like enzyme